MEQTDTRKFYDIHMHAFNLAHPNLSAFLKRTIRNSWCMLLKWLLVAAGLLYMLYLVLRPHPYIAFGLLFLFILLIIFVVAVPVITTYSGSVYSFIARRFKRPLNLLALMENDLGNYFLLMEKVLLERTPHGKLTIDGQVYERIVITPLMMDFGTKNIISEDLIYGSKPIRKPIAQQVTDVFNGIATYVQRTPHFLFEIYPFLGLNTNGYELQDLKRLLDKYFKDYKRSQQALCANMGAFTGDIDTMGSNFFAGIKVYPPLGFDPWPEQGEGWKEKREKVEWLYGYCCERKIPITTHCNDGGFVVDSLFVTLRRATPEKWMKVLERFPALRLNLAHMGDEKSVFSRYKTGRPWTDIVLELAAKYENVYTDFSCMEFKDSDYAKLQKLIERKSVEAHYDLSRKILFGSDFMINLQWIDSYNRYLNLFCATKQLKENKHLYCAANPERFLFG